MGMIAYDAGEAAAFAASRELTDDAAAEWRAAVTRHAAPAAGMRLLDLGAGTGSWAHAFERWFPGLSVLAVEPSPQMRARAGFRPMLAGNAVALPLRDHTADVAWLSTMVHHIPDRRAAARELRRVLRPGAPVLIRGVFAGRPEGISLFRFFPEAIDVLDRYPSVDDVSAEFAEAGFATTAVEAIPETTAATWAEVADRLRREAHTLLQLISDDAYAAGRARLAAAATDLGPVIDRLDLMVLR